MNLRAKIFIVVTGGIAVGCAMLLYLSDPAVPADRVGSVVLLSLLALIAEALALVTANSVTGSVAFIPYLAAALIAPHWISLVGVVTVRVLGDLILKRRPAISLFNVFQQTTTFSLAVLAYRFGGGESMAALGHLPITKVTVAIGLPTLAAFVTSFVVNFSLVLGFQSAKSNQRFLELVRTTYPSALALDVLATPIVFLFAWAYVSWGAYAATALWVPILGLRQLHKNNLELERTNSELLELMVKSMEARDPYTSGHSRRVQSFSIAIAKGLGLPAADVEKVGRAALLHDVGKIHEKYAPILRKPGRLSPDEWQTMQQHPSDGSELVSTMSKLHDVVPDIRHHHERWDGTGYPNGLAGETIPKGSRVIAFADTIDAMISERPYRRTMSEAEVRAEIVRCRGTQFDPAMTDKILSAPVWRLLFAPEAQSVVARSGLTLVGSADSSLTKKQA